MLPKVIGQSVEIKAAGKMVRTSEHDLNNLLAELKSLNKDLNSILKKMDQEEKSGKAPILSGDLIDAIYKESEMLNKKISEVF